MGWYPGRFCRFRSEGGLPANSSLSDECYRQHSLIHTKDPWKYRRTSKSHAIALAAATRLLAPTVSIRYAPTLGSTFCNLYALDIAEALGVPIPRTSQLRDGGQLAAADLNRWLGGPGRFCGWVPVRSDCASGQAMTTAVVGFRPPQQLGNSSGHIAIVLPGISSSGFALMTFAGRAQSDCEAVSLNKFSFFAYRGTPEVCVDGDTSGSGALESRLAFIEWSLGQLLWERLPPKGFENWHVTKAVIAAEDSRFFCHRGVDLFAMARAAYKTALGRLQGGSTLVQQLIRRILGWYEVTSERKFFELLLAVRLAEGWPSRLLLWAHLQSAYFGHFAYGIDGVAEALYSRPAQDLSLSQAAVVAASLKYPWRRAETANRASVRNARALRVEAMLR
jgi:hypothetical protein